MVLSNRWRLALLVNLLQPTGQRFLHFTDCRVQTLPKSAVSLVSYRLVAQAQAHFCIRTPQLIPNYRDRTGPKHADRGRPGNPSLLASVQ